MSQIEKNFSTQHRMRRITEVKSNEQNFTLQKLLEIWERVFFLSFSRMRSSLKSKVIHRWKEQFYALF